MVNKFSLESCSQEPHDFSHVECQTDYTEEWEEISYDYISFTFVFDKHKWVIETSDHSDTNSVLFNLITDLIETKTLVTIDEFKNMVKDLIGFISEKEVVNGKIN